MRDVTPFKLKPDYQTEGAEVEFDLTPLDLASQYRLQADIAINNIPSWEVAEAIVRKHLVGWVGLEPPYSRQAKQDVLAGQSDLRWCVWIGQITRALLDRSNLSEAERKN